MLGQLGIGDPAAGFMRILRLATVFAGIAALFTAGGIGRLAAYASASRGRRHAMWVAARAHAVASAGLVLIATIPLGHLPERWPGFIPIGVAGLVCGAVCGALIGAVCGGAAPVGLADVWWLAKRPSEALRQLLGPDELVRLGTALRNRTTNLFEGMFEPGAKAPDQKGHEAHGDKAAATPAPGVPAAVVEPDATAKPKVEPTPP